MNEQKLKMLLKFERIKMLEDFYNVRVFPFSLDLEIQPREIGIVGGRGDRGRGEDHGHWDPWERDQSKE